MVECNRRVADCAAEIIVSHGYDDIVDLEDEFASNVIVDPEGSLPEKADLLYIEMFGHTLLEEGVCGLVQVRGAPDQAHKGSHHVGKTAKCACT
eukprot:scaffold3697_cov390-Prasinococcus_capsulatus_cf.AAC.15